MLSLLLRLECVKLYLNLSRTPLVMNIDIFLDNSLLGTAIKWVEIVSGVSLATIVIVRFVSE